MSKTIYIIIATLVLLVVAIQQQVNQPTINQSQGDKIDFNSTSQVIGGDNTKAFTYPTEGVGDTTKVKD